MCVCVLCSLSCLLERKKIKDHIELNYHLIGDFATFKMAEKSEKTSSSLNVDSHSRVSQALSALGYAAASIAIIAINKSVLTSWG